MYVICTEHVPASSTLIYYCHCCGSDLVFPLEGSSITTIFLVDDTIMRKLRYPRHNVKSHIKALQQNMYISISISISIYIYIYIYIKFKPIIYIYIISASNHNTITVEICKTKYRRSSNECGMRLPSGPVQPVPPFFGYLLGGGCSSMMRHSRSGSLWRSPPRFGAYDWVYQ